MKRWRQLFPVLGITPRACSGFRLCRCLCVWACLGLCPQARAQLPTDAGQTWKTYDLGPFVAAAGPESEKHVVEWILQETGYPAWHGGIPTSLSAADGKLSCFNTPEMQARVADIVQRFVDEAAAPHRFTVRVFGIDGPGWRAKARSSLQPIPTATPGVQAWILPRETAGVVLAGLRGRSDVTELPTGPVLAANGLPSSIKGGRQQVYVEDYLPRPEAFPGWQPQQATCDEGLAIDLQPLVSADTKGVEATFRCRIDQIERMAQVALPAPAGGPPVAVQVPQVAAVRIGERFRWPASHTLVIGLGLVPWPVPAQNGAVSALLPSVERRDVVIVI